MTEQCIDYSAVFSDDIAPDRAVSRRRKGYKRQQTIKEQFDAFHAANPFVYDLLVKFARMVKKRGVHHYSMQALMEQVRWHVLFEAVVYTWSPGTFKLNNNFCAHYARLVMEQEPDLHGMFNLRVLKAA
jgi:hypothetical protein